MKDYNLDQEEIELLDSIESGEWESIDNVKEEISFQQEIVKNTLKKDKRVPVVLSYR